MIDGSKNLNIAAETANVLTDLNSSLRLCVNSLVTFYPNFTFFSYLRICNEVITYCKRHLNKSHRYTLHVNMNKTNSIKNS